MFLGGEITVGKELGSVLKQHVVMLVAEYPHRFLD